MKQFCADSIAQNLKTLKRSEVWGLVFAEILFFC